MDALNIIGAVGSIASLLELTVKVLDLVTHFAAAFRTAPSVIEQAIAKLSIWKLHVQETTRLSEKEDINHHLLAILQDSPVLGNIRRCLERFEDIINKAKRAHGQTITSALQPLALHFKEHEVEKLLREMDDNMQHLQFAVQTEIL